MARFVFVVLALSAAALLDSSAACIPPDYLCMVEKYQKALLVLNRLSPVPNVVVDKTVSAVDVSRHYGLLLNSVLQVAKVVADSHRHVTYDEYYYPGVKVAVAEAWLLPGVVGKKVVQAEEVVQSLVDNVVVLVQEVCPGKSKEECGRVVDQYVVEYPEYYKLSRDVLVLVSKLSNVYLKNTYEVEAKKHVVLKVLVEGKQELKELVSRVVDVVVVVNDAVVKPAPKPVPVLKG